MRRIVHIEEPALQLFIPDAAAFAIVFPDRNQSKQRSVMVSKHKKTVIALGKDYRLQRVLGLMKFLLLKQKDLPKDFLK